MGAGSSVVEWLARGLSGLRVNLLFWQFIQ